MMPPGFAELLFLVLAATQDTVYKKSFEAMQAAFHELILDEADSRRVMVASSIRRMGKLDAEVIRFKREYTRISGQLSPEALEAIDCLLEIIQQKKKDIIHEKNMMKTIR